MEGFSHRHLHDRVHKMAKRQASVVTEGGTVFSIVYVTAEPTFTGVIGGYTTLTEEESGTSASNSFPAAATQALSPTVEFSTAPTETVVAETGANTQTATKSTHTLTSPTVFSNANTSADKAVAGANATAGASANSSSSSDQGISTGAKAGIAIGVIALVGLIAVILLFILGKKKKQRQAQAARENEKSGYGAGAASATPPTEMVNRSPTSAQAPRLSLRPVSRMLPEFLGSTPKGRLSGGNLLNTIGESAPAPAPARGPSPTPQPRGPSPAQPRPQENPFADPQNPFADPEKPALVPAPLSISSVASKPPSLAPIAVTPFAAVAAGAINASGDTPAHSHTNSLSTPAPVPTTASISENTLAPLPVPAPISVPSTPVTPASVIAAGPGATEQPQGNVYRIMMDFKPSMDDELELTTGQLVRMLHEYDDGWALCIRLDRSQQGVVPRTCLAAKPSKPKPSHLNQYANSPQAMRPAPASAGSRPMSPAGNYGPPRAGPPSRPMSQRPMSPAGRPGQRPMSPAGRPGSRPMSPAGRSMSPGPFNQAPRPLSPGPRPQQRSMSPGPYGGRGGPPSMGGNQSRRRSNSASAMNVRDRRNTPPGPSNLRQGSTAQAPGIAL